MNQISPQLRKATYGYTHYCPGCEESHYIQTEGKPSWKFNGSIALPSFTPSVKISNGHYSRPEKKECWCNFKERTGMDSSFKCGICHYHIINGQIQYCNDSTHHLAGKTVPLPPLPEWLQD